MQLIISIIIVYYVSCASKRMTKSDVQPSKKLLASSTTSSTNKPSSEYPIIVEFTKYDIHGIWPKGTRSEIGFNNNIPMFFTIFYSDSHFYKGVRNHEYIKHGLPAKVIDSIHQYNSDLMSMWLHIHRDVQNDNLGERHTKSKKQPEKYINLQETRPLSPDNEDSDVYQRFFGFNYAFRSNTSAEQIQEDINDEKKKRGEHCYDYNPAYNTLINMHYLLPSYMTTAFPVAFQFGSRYLNNSRYIDYYQNLPDSIKLPNIELVDKIIGKLKNAQENTPPLIRCHVGQPMDNITPIKGTRPCIRLELIHEGKTWKTMRLSTTYTSRIEIPYFPKLPEEDDHSSQPVLKNSNQMEVPAEEQVMSTSSKKGITDYNAYARSSFRAIVDNLLAVRGKITGNASINDMLTASIHNLLGSINDLDIKDLLDTMSVDPLFYDVNMFKMIYRQMKKPYVGFDVASKSDGQSQKGRKRKGQSESKPNTGKIELTPTKRTVKHAREVEDISKEGDLFFSPVMDYILPEWYTMLKEFDVKKLYWLILFLQHGLTKIPYSPGQSLDPIEYFSQAKFLHHLIDNKDMGRHICDNELYQTFDRVNGERVAEYHYCFVCFDPISYEHFHCYDENIGDAVLPDQRVDSTQKAQSDTSSAHSLPIGSGKPVATSLQIQKTDGLQNKQKRTAKSTTEEEKEETGKQKGKKEKKKIPDPLPVTKREYVVNNPITSVEFPIPWYDLRAGWKSKEGFSEGFIKKILYTQIGQKLTDKYSELTRQYSNLFVPANLNWSELRDTCRTETFSKYIDLLKKKGTNLDEQIASLMEIKENNPVKMENRTMIGKWEQFHNMFYIFHPYEKRCPTQKRKAGSLPVAKVTKNKPLKTSSLVRIDEIRAEHEHQIKKVDFGKKEDLEELSDIQEFEIQPATKIKFGGKVEEFAEESLSGDEVDATDKKDDDMLESTELLKTEVPLKKDIPLSAEHEEETSPMQPASKQKVEIATEGQSHDFGDALYEIPKSRSFKTIVHNTSDLNEPDVVKRPSRALSTNAIRNLDIPKEADREDIPKDPHQEEEEIIGEEEEDKGELPIIPTSVETLDGQFKEKMERILKILNEKVEAYFKE